MEPIDTVCVFGAGFMGWQIALQCATYGFPVKLYDISQDALIRASQSIKEELDKRVEDRRMSKEERLNSLNKIYTTRDMVEATSGVDLVIEAVPERLEVKRKVFAMMDKVCDEHTILATNSSSICISKIEDATLRLDKLLNTHFYNIPWSRSVVELMRGNSTSDETLERVRRFMESIGLTPLIVLKESTGFIFNRVWRAIKKECLHLVDEGVATFQDVDRIWMILYEKEIGPFGMMDRVGLDVVRDIEMVYYKESGDNRDAPPGLLLEKIEKGELGIKTGKGFYSYPKPEFREPGWLRREKSKPAGDP
ncbi:MAG: 3-hydroxyacyl-CoA dehydrogenase family protein [Candidatus Bathyarchaeota archaeon]|jgi:3-hydroxybutyryl-CoA dehydrogenase